MSIFNNRRKNILILGSNGMLGYEVFKSLTNISNFKYVHIGHVIGIDVEDGVDLNDEKSFEDFLNGIVEIDYCINCVAHTNTNVAESSTDGGALDYKLNALLPKSVAEVCKRKNIKLIHISTDYVFSEFGSSCENNADNDTDTQHLFDTDSTVFPKNKYGIDKLIGETNIKNVFGEKSKNYAILRTSWIYGMHNSKSFIHKFIRNVLKTQGGCVEMTENEKSVPTSCSCVVDCVLDVINHERHGVLHAVPNCVEHGVSRLSFASEILKSFRVHHGMFDDVKINGVNRNSYWPTFSAMKTSFDFTSNWNEYLDEFIKEHGIEIIGDVNESI